VVPDDALAYSRLDFWNPSPDDLRAKVKRRIAGIIPNPKP